MNVMSLISSFNPADAQNLYIQFLNRFPTSYQPLISFGVGVLLIYTVYRIIRRDFIFLIVLVIFIPASIPVLKSVWSILVGVVKYLLNYKNA